MTMTEEERKLRKKRPNPAMAVGTMRVQFAGRPEIAITQDAFRNRTPAYLEALRRGGLPPLPAGLSKTVPSPASAIGEAARGFETGAMGMVGRGLHTRRGGVGGYGQGIIPSSGPLLSPGALEARVGARESRVSEQAWRESGISDYNDPNYYLPKPTAQPAAAIAPATAQQTKIDRQEREQSGWDPEVIIRQQSRTPQGRAIINRILGETISVDGVAHPLATSEGRALLTKYAAQQPEGQPAAAVLAPVTSPDEPLRPAVSTMEDLTRGLTYGRGGPSESWSTAGRGPAKPGQAAAAVSPEMQEYRRIINKKLTGPKDEDMSGALNMTYANFREKFPKMSEENARAFFEKLPVVIEARSRIARHEAKQRKIEDAAVRTIQVAREGIRRSIENTYVVSAEKKVDKIGNKLIALQKERAEEDDEPDINIEAAEHARWLKKHNRIRDDIAVIMGGAPSDIGPQRGTLAEAQARLAEAQRKRDQIGQPAPEVEGLGVIRANPEMFKTPEGGEPIPKPPPGYYDRVARMLTSPTPIGPATQPTTQPTSQPTTRPAKGVLPPHIQSQIDGGVSLADIDVPEGTTPEEARRIIAELQRMGIK